MKHTLSGKIEYLDTDYNQLTVGGKTLSVWMEEFQSDIIKLTYHVSKTENSIESITEVFLTQFYKGIVDVENDYISGTSWTGIYDRNDEVTVSGHDIIFELSSFEGKYVIIQVET